MNMGRSDQEMYDELSLYTLQKGDQAFIHQNIVDAYAAQHADKTTKPIKIAFALIGLFLNLEKNYTGREVQLAHMKMGEEKKQWPIFKLPEKRGDITVSDVLRTEPGPSRDAMIHAWCESVWESWRENHQQVKELVAEELEI